MDNVKEVLNFVNKQYEYYHNRASSGSDDVATVMVDIINNFKKSEETQLTEGDLQYGWFRSLEANFVRHPITYRSCTSVNLSDNIGLDLEIAKELVMFFRKVAEIQRK